jgi:uncharacterized protein (DUF488 family)
MSLYTIGYAGYTAAAFISELKRFSVHILIDMRLSPFSEYFPDYNKNYLEHILGANAVRYRGFADEFALPLAVPPFFTPECPDLESYTKTANFKTGAERIADQIWLGNNYVFMCAEQDPLFCRRAVTIAREFDKLGIQVIHILSNSELLSQNDLEGALLESCYPNFKQARLLLLEERPTEEVLDEAYKKRSFEIGGIKDESV